MSQQTFYPTLRYRDPHAAIAWFENTLGFERNAVYEEGGIVAHAQLTFRGGMIMLGTATDEREGYGSIAPPPGSGSTYVVVDDPDALHDHAVAAGADVAMPLRDQDYGSRDFTLRDPEGNIWSFGTYDPWKEAAG